MPAQLYGDHIRAVVDIASARADAAAAHSPRFAAVLRAAVRHAAEWHDLGKLVAENQRVLTSSDRARLPVNHVDAGVAHLLRGAATDPARSLAALLVHAHHRGLPAILEEAAFESLYLRDRMEGADGGRACDRTDAALDELVARHRVSVGGSGSDAAVAKCGRQPMLFRLALSCLADGDHADTAQHYGDAPLHDDPPLRAADRLAALDEYVAGLSVGKSDDRTRLRRAVYDACRGAPPPGPLLECDSPVGTGKTTAVMAHLLRVAAEKGLRRVFVVLPYTNIITQSVRVYRKCLGLDGEDLVRVVAEHHHKAEFEHHHTRQFTALWHAPIVVTTAVQFFETLAGNRPAALRKLHQLPGSAVFIDESHAALPAPLWPRAWDWLKQLATDWGCHIVFGSGSLNRVWRMPEVDAQRPDLPRIVPPAVAAATATAEAARVRFRTRPNWLSLDDAAAWVTNTPGPRLVIVNTVQTAAALARWIAGVHGRGAVEHLSTALTPADRDVTLSRVLARLARRQDDADWTLVATSCVEAGVDISFRSGFRERAGLTSLLQTAGRVNRSNEHDSADVWDFRLAPGGLVTHNPGLQDAARVLGQLFAEGRVSPEWCTEALRREILEQYSADLHAGLAKAERDLNFPAVREQFRVIDQDTVTAVVATDLVERLARGERVGWQELQRGSVSLYRTKAETVGLPADAFPAFPGLYRWTLAYDEFLGYMAGGLASIEAE